MKILMLSWEYPPKNVGGLSNHVYNLSHALASLGHEVYVVTCEEKTAPVEENDDGVYVHRVTPYKIDTEDFTKWVMHLNFSMIEECTRLMKKIGKVDMIHVHDWLCVYCGKVLKWSYKIPMVCTIHATEKGRNNGIRTEMQRYISSAEWLLTYESWKIVACSGYMKAQIVDTFNTPEEKVWIIPNGIDLNSFDFDFDWLKFRRKYACDDEKIVFFIGRHVFEKGIQILIDAAPGIVSEYNKTKFIIAGTGPMTEELKDKVKSIGLQDKFLFTGYMDNKTKKKFYRVASVAVFPSLYEPFGIVLLEAMAAGCPAVVSDTGGFGEIIQHRSNGMKMINSSVESLKDNVLEILKNDSLAQTVRRNAIKTVEDKYTWQRVSKLTTEMYELIKEEARYTEWDQGSNKLKEDKLKKNKEKTKVKVKNSLKDENTEETNIKKSSRVKGISSDVTKVILTEAATKELLGEVESKE
ncbi:glycosyltransferase involved in cell wall biosynthesis [Clostridium acetobutylicum]|uniref:LPS glycosyltransferase n=1 Tax=Clostridium acetobutylicum (strain ATCC 824 / DSM 792 / JCM 1419 / IAM 19013 / LMG 5710 / NBRC 13948 / NRRL B-527 / VKM B-1787 / 2291 / W) TaxID=272562 RepID=Q97K66_CLOAB|nr:MULTISPECIES: glycosyltransferase family 4 protein [Clostridium]AAK79029.1 LPS glycosyltransferase [Clostridium acetobutylicum ATCC 824]ADZ20104.1 LPS glycosyltransferase [Clostridium acetobutylicum EA 2018]AEI33960.1 LPS glycosyltransferase [Clostridium acetobutylicum DSM 1731]AWV81715.1 glycosyltransferase family 1 protein [Clostridium acetobutylicum]MBC2395257.1 glycosyltransferase family 4 protein [Clostridium acetobutylicum]